MKYFQHQKIAWLLLSHVIQKVPRCKMKIKFYLHTWKDPRCHNHITNRVFSSVRETGLYFFLAFRNISLVRCTLVKYFQHQKITCLLLSHVIRKVPRPKDDFHSLVRCIERHFSKYIWTREYNMWQSNGVRNRPWKGQAEKSNSPYRLGVQQCSMRSGGKRFAFKVTYLSATWFCVNLWKPCQ